MPDRFTKMALGKTGYRFLMPTLMRHDNYLAVQELCVRRAIYLARHAWPWQVKQRMESVRDCHRIWKESRELDRQLGEL